MSLWWWFITDIVCMQFPNRKLPLFFFTSGIWMKNWRKLHHEVTPEEWHRSTSWTVSVRASDPLPFVISPILILACYGSDLLLFFAVSPSLSCSLLQDVVAVKNYLHPCSVLIWILNWMIHSLFSFGIVGRTAPPRV